MRPESTESEPEPRPAISRKGKKSDVPSMLERRRMVRGVGVGVEVEEAVSDDDRGREVDTVPAMAEFCLVLFCLSLFRQRSIPHGLD